jgi:hypothetical protein
MHNGEVSKQQRLPAALCIIADAANISTILLGRVHVHKRDAAALPCCPLGRQHQDQMLLQIVHTPKSMCTILLQHQQR